MIKRMFSLTWYEFCLLYKQSIILIFITSLAMSLSLCVFSFSTNLKSNYAKELDRNSPDGFEFAVECSSISDFIKSNEMVDLLGFKARNVTFSSTLIANGHSFKTEQKENTDNGIFVNNFSGEAYFFNDNIPIKFKDIIFHDGVCFNNYKFNEKNQELYPIFVSSFIAEKLFLKINDLVEINNDSGDIEVGKLKVAGIYSYPDNTKSLPYFVFPINFCLEKEQHIKQPIYFMHLNKTSRIFDTYYKLTALKIIPKTLGNFFEEIKLVKTNEILLISFSIIILIVAFLIMSNILNIILHLRNCYIAKLKLMGASSNCIASIYYLMFAILYIISFLISIFLNFAMKTYYEKVGENLFQFQFSINFQWHAIISLLVGSIILFVFKFFMFRKRIKATNSWDYMRKQ